MPTEKLIVQNVKPVPVAVKKMTSSGENSLPVRRIEKMRNDGKLEKIS